MIHIIYLNINYKTECYFIQQISSKFLQTYKLANINIHDQRIKLIKTRRRFPLTMILPLEKRGGATFTLRFLDLEQIRVDKVSHGAFVERCPMLVDRLLKEVRHFRAVLRYLVANLLETGQITHHGDEVDGGHAAEQLETLLDQVHESFEPIVAMLETHSHYDGAYNVADRHSKGGRNVRRYATFRRQSTKKRPHLALKSNLLLL